MVSGSPIINKRSGNPSCALRTLRLALAASNKAQEFSGL
jgi:hypothetical protein